MSNEILTQIEEKESELLRLYHETYGGGSAEFRQFKQFLISGIRKGAGRKIVANFQSSPIEAGKQTGAESWSAIFAHRPTKTAQPLQAPVPQQQDNKADQSGAAVAVEGSDIKDDILKLSITAVSEKYTNDQLRECAKMIDATIADAMNSKQIIKSIAAKLKADEIKG